MAAIEGFSYDELRNLPIPELMKVQAEVHRIGEIRKKAMRR